ncbi:MAG TPA: hypothetical protein VIH45_11460, partial [Desulfuromonadaceae bacterium]
MRTTVAVAGLILMLAARVLAEDTVDGMPSREAVVRQVSEQVEKIYAKEGGKRDRKIIRAEYIGNSTIKGMVLAAEESLNKQAYDKVHAIIAAAGSTIADIRKEQPKARLNAM